MDTRNSANEYLAGLNIAMLARFNARERKERHWRELMN